VKHLARVATAVWQFVVGDDWRLALGVAISIGAVALLVELSVNAWWLLPVAVPTLLWISVSRAAGRRGRRSRRV
jgi:hypothetical protein